MSSNGPGPGVASAVAAMRQRALNLELPGKPGVKASPDVVARLLTAKSFLELGAESLRLNLGDGVKDYGLGDVELLLAQCGEAFSRYDTVGAN